MAKVSKPDRQEPAGRAGASYALGEKLFGRPLAMSPEAAGWLYTGVRDGQFDQAQVSVEGSKFVGRVDPKTRYRVDDGVAIVPVSGMLLDRGAWLGDFYGFATSYEGLAHQFRELAKDEAIKAVVLDIDSGGGMVAGLWDLATEIDALKKKKPVYALAQNMAASAAYAIGCTAHEFYVARSGAAGSIGVIAVHTSFERALDAAGLDPTIIASGEHKADGHPAVRLEHGALAEFERTVDKAAGEFFAHVARYRKGLDAEAVKGLQARTFDGEEAVEQKLADGVKSFTELMKHVRAALKSKAKGGTNPPADPPASGGMAASPKAATADVPQLKGQSMDETTQGGAAITATVDPAKIQADTLARVQSILGAEGAEGAPELAKALAFDAAISAESAAKLLAAAAADRQAAVDAAVAAVEPAPVDAIDDAAQGRAEMNNALEARMADPKHSAGVKPEGEAESASAAPRSTGRLAARFGEIAERRSPRLRRPAR